METLKVTMCNRGQVVENKMSSNTYLSLIYTLCHRSLQYLFLESDYIYPKLTFILSYDFVW